MTEQERLERRLLNGGIKKRHVLYEKNKGKAKEYYEKNKEKRREYQREYEKRKREAEKRRIEEELLNNINE